MSNEKNRPLGVGVQGLADVYQKMKLPFDSEYAGKVNLDIFETLYYGCLLASYEQSVARGKRVAEMRAAGDFTYVKGDVNVTFHDDEYASVFPSGLSVKHYERIVQMHKRKMYGVDSDGNLKLSEFYDDLAGLKLTVKEFDTVVKMYKDGEDAVTYMQTDRYVKCGDEYKDLEPLMVDEFERDDDVCGSYVNFEGCPLSKGMFQFDMWGFEATDRYDWNALRKGIMKHGVRNSLLTALMPTASTSQIMGNNECIEPYTSNIYVRNTMAGAFVVINKHLIKDLVRLGVWTNEMKDMIIAQNGSVQGLDGVPPEIQEIYKTAWELKQKTLIDQSADRGRFICQTQSMNLFFIEPPVKVLHSAQMYGWRKGLKTGSYYIRSLPKSQAQQVTIDPHLVKKMKLMKQNNGSVSGVSDAGSVSGVSGVSRVSSVGSNKDYVSSPSSNDSVVVNVLTKEKMERENEVKKVLGRTCSIFNTDCEACSS